MFHTALSALTFSSGEFLTLTESRGSERCLELDLRGRGAGLVARVLPAARARSERREGALRPVAEPDPSGGPAPDAGAGRHPAGARPARGHRPGDPDERHGAHPLADDGGARLGGRAARRPQRHGARRERPRAAGASAAGGAPPAERALPHRAYRDLLDGARPGPGHPVRRGSGPRASAGGDLRRAVSPDRSGGARGLPGGGRGADRAAGVLPGGGPRAPRQRRALALPDPHDAGLGSGRDLSGPLRAPSTPSATARRPWSACTRGWRIP